MATGLNFIYNVYVKGTVVVEVRKNVSHSEVESYLRCRRAHFYAYGLDIQAKHTGDALRRGKAGHAILEHGLKTIHASQNPADLWPAMQEEYQRKLNEDSELIVLLADVIKPLRYFGETFFHEQGWEILEVERNEVLDISDTLGMRFITDYTIKDRWGDILVLDAKFQYDFFSKKHLAIVPQLAKYVAARQIMGMPVNGVGYMEFRYRGKKDDAPSDRFKFSKVPLTAARIQRTFTEQVWVAEEIQRVKSQDFAVWHNTAPRVFNTKTCESCQFFELCQTELSEPHKAQEILDMNFVKRERREENGNGSEPAESTVGVHALA